MSSFFPSIYGLTKVLRYLSAALGRPMMINDDDITIPYPEAVVSSSQGIEDPHEAKTVPGIVAHIKLAPPSYHVRVIVTYISPRYTDLLRSQHKYSGGFMALRNTTESPGMSRFPKSKHSSAAG